MQGAGNIRLPPRWMLNCWIDKIQYVMRNKYILQENVLIWGFTFLCWVVKWRENKRKILIFWLDNEITIRSHFYFPSSNWFPNLNNTIWFIVECGQSREDWAVEDKWGEKIWSDFSPWWQLRLIGRLWFCGSANIIQPPHQTQSPS